MKRNTWILSGILILLVLATVLVLRQPGETSSTGGTGEVLARYDSAGVDRIEVRSPSGNVTLALEAGKWMLTSPIHYRADDAAVAGAVGKGRNIDLKSLVSSNPLKQSLFQVDSSATLVRIFERGAERATFRVGKPGTSYTETYVRQENSHDVYLADGLLTYIYSRPLKDWRDKAIFKADQATIANIRFLYGDTTFALAIRDSMWLVDGDATVETNVRSFLGSLANYQADDFVDSLPTSLPPLSGQIDVNGVSLRFFFIADGNKYYVQSSEMHQLFAVQNWRASQILKRKKDFLRVP